MEENFKIVLESFIDKKDAFLNVIPLTDSWVILLDGISLGTLGNDGNDGWYWLEGSLPSEDAELVGLKLEAHYK